MNRPAQSFQVVSVRNGQQRLMRRVRERSSVRAAGKCGSEELQKARITSRLTTTECCTSILATPFARDPARLPRPSHTMLHISAQCTSLGRITSPRSGDCPLFAASLCSAGQLLEVACSCWLSHYSHRPAPLGSPPHPKRACRSACGQLYHAVLLCMSIIPNNPISHLANLFLTATAVHPSGRRRPAVRGLHSQSIEAVHTVSDLFDRCSAGDWRLDSLAIASIASPCRGAVPSHSTSCAPLSPTRNRPLP